MARAGDGDAGATRDPQPPRDRPAPAWGGMIPAPQFARWLGTGPVGRGLAMVGGSSPGCKSWWPGAPGFQGTGHHPP